MGGNKLVIITEPKTFHFEWPKNVGFNLKHVICSLIKHNAFLAKHTIKNKIKQLFFKYKHVNNIHEHRKQRNEWTTQIYS